MYDERTYLLALNFIKGLGHVGAKKLLAHFGSAKAVFEAKKGIILKIPGLRKTTIDELTSRKPLERAAEEISKAGKINADLICYTDKEFPVRLKQIPDAPFFLYKKGNINLNAKRYLAIVGTRKPTHYGIDMTEKIIRELKAYNVVIVSGLAYGIDIIAHRAALKNNIPTIGIMGSGIDIIYPAIHRNEAVKMVRNGAVIAEQPIGTQPEAYNFPTRNRVISGMCDAILVIEAASKGGALITAELANGYDRDVFAVPGEVGKKYSEGCNKLIRDQKAHLITSAEDLAYFMDWSREEDILQDRSPSPDFDGLNEDERKVVEILMANKEGIHIDMLSWQSGIPMNKIASVLLKLEFEGMIKSLSGKKLKLIK